MKIGPGTPTLIFDLDGTLIDPRKGVIGAFRHACKSLGLAEVSDFDAGALIGPPLQDTFASRWNLGSLQVARAVSSYREYFSAKGIHEFVEYPGITALLQGLADSGYRLLMATSKPDVYASQIVSMAGWSSIFQRISGATLDGTRRHKADVIRDALSNVAPGLVPIMIGDRTEDILGAAANGLPSIGVCWGFGTRNDLATAGADLLVETVTELTGAVHAIVSRGNGPAC